MKIKFQLAFSIEDEKTWYNCKKDSVFLCGCIKALGSWNLSEAIEMKPKLNIDPMYLDQSSLSVSSLSLSSSSSSEILTDSLSPTTNMFEFETVVEFDESAEAANLTDGLQYKYFIAQKTSLGKDKLFLKQIEYNFRKLELDAQRADATNPLSPVRTIETNDKWPLMDSENRQTRLDNGWLLKDESEIQFHFFKNPVQLWSRDENTNFYIDIVPWKVTNGLYEVKDYLVSSANFDDNDILLNKKTKFNSVNNSHVYSSYRVRSFENPLDLLFQINFMEIDDDGKVNEAKCRATGYYKVNKSLIDNSVMDVDVSLLSSNQIVGSIKAEILLITSVKELENYFIKKNYNYHFNRSCIPIGHRGMGKTFDAGTLPGTNFVENTIDSFREAYNRGAQMVEFDVVLTKDNIPIVYHDFNFCIDQLNLHNNDLKSNKYLSLSVNQLTYDEVKQNRIYSQKILKKATNISEDLKDFFTSKLMFPTLEEMCTQLDTKLGFNVEIKYPIDLEDGSHEADHHIKWLNRSDYVDVILKKLYACCQDDARCVILSTFDPNLCSMLRIKQNKFPVLFLTNGITSKWVPYKDPRCKNTRKSFNYAKSENLHGIVAHAEELTKNLHLINILFNHTSKSTNFLAYSWGDDLNELDKRRLLSQSGLDGIIYDRIDESS